MDALKPRELIKKAGDAQKRLEALNKESHELHETSWTEERRIKYDVYQPQIFALEDQCVKAVNEVKKKAELRELDIRDECKAIAEPILWVKKILNYLRIKKTEVSLQDDEVKAYHDKKVVPAGFLLSDTLMVLKAFVVENDKPTNKYSLVVLGRTIFSGEQFTRWPHAWGLSLQGNSYDIERVVKDAPTVSELAAYLRKHSSEITQSVLGDYLTLKSEYLMVKENYTLADFKPLATIKCQCGFFWTLLDDPGRNLWCPVCQKQINCEVKV